MKRSKKDLITLTVSARDLGYLHDALRGYEVTCNAGQSQCYDAMTPDDPERNARIRKNANRWRRHGAKSRAFAVQISAVLCMSDNGFKGPNRLG